MIACVLEQTVIKIQVKKGAVDLLSASKGNPREGEQILQKG